MDLDRLNLDLRGYINLDIHEEFLDEYNELLLINDENIRNKDILKEVEKYIERLKLYKKNKENMVEKALNLRYTNHSHWINVCGGEEELNELQKGIVTSGMAALPYEESIKSDEHADITIFSKNFETWESTYGDSFIVHESIEDELEKRINANDEPIPIVFHF